MNTRIIPSIVILLTSTLSIPLSAEDKSAKVTIPQKSQVQSLKKAPNVAPQVKPQDNKTPEKSITPSKPRIDLKKVAPKKNEPVVKPTITKRTNLKPQSLQPSINRTSTAKPASAKPTTSTRPPAPKTANLSTKPDTSSLPSKKSISSILGTKPSTKSSGLIPTKVPNKKTASIPTPKKIDPSLKPRTPGTMETPSLVAKKDTSLAERKDLPGHSGKVQPTLKPASQLAVKPSTELQIDRKELGQSAGKIGDRVVERETLGQRNMGTTAGGSSLGERSGAGGQTQSGVRDKVAGQLGLNQGKLAGLGKERVVDSAIFGEGTARWKQSPNGKLSRTPGAGYADISYSFTGEDGKIWNVIVSFQNPNEAIPATGTHDAAIDDKSQTIVLSVVQSVGSFKKRSEVQAYADNVVDTYGTGIYDATASSPDGQEPSGQTTTENNTSETERDQMSWAWEETPAGSDNQSDGDEMQWAWEADEGSSNDSSSGGSTESSDGDEMKWAWEDDSNGEASADPTPDPDSDQRTAGGEDPAPGNHANGQEDKRKLSASLSGGGRNTVRTGDDVPRGGASQTAAGRSGDNDTVRIDPDAVRGGEVTDAQLARLAQENNPESGQSGDGGGRDGIDLPDPLGGLAGGPVINPGGGAGDPSNLRNGTKPGTLLETIRQENLQTAGDSIQNIQQAGH